MLEDAFHFFLRGAHAPRVLAIAPPRSQTFDALKDISARAPKSAREGACAPRRRDRICVSSVARLAIYRRLNVPALLQRSPDLLLRQLLLLRPVIRCVLGWPYFATNSAGFSQSGFQSMFVICVSGRRKFSGCDGIRGTTPCCEAWRVSPRSCD